MKPLVIIPARAGSKGLPGKNLLPICGKPMIQYTLEAARKIFADANICVTTDDPEIINLAIELGMAVPFVRPSELASDHSGTLDVIFHALEFYNSRTTTPYDTVVLLQPTSPLRTENHIQGALQKYKAGDDMVVSVCRTKSNPYYVLFEENNDGYLIKSKESDVKQRQDLPDVWEVNGAIYVINVKSLYEQRTIGGLRRIRKYVMDSISSIDIDEQMDALIAETILRSGFKSS